MSTDRGAVDAACDILGAKAERNGPIGPLTTYRVGGLADVLVRASGPADLEAIGRAVRASRLPVLVVGMGSNLLVADAGFRGVAVILDDSEQGFGAIGVEDTTVRAGGAVALPVLARRTVRAGLTGLEWAVGVPGSVGGALTMNAGGHGSDVAATLLRAWIADLSDSGKVTARSCADLALGYRTSAVADDQVVVEAEFRLRHGDVEAGNETIREIVRWRREHQPGGQNAGSVFTNPRDDPQGRSAGELVDAAGWRGRRIGTAEVSPKHANFIQADRDGSADDVRALMLRVQAAVEERFGVCLRPENHLVGFGGPRAQHREPGR